MATIALTFKEAEKRLVGKISKVDGERFICALEALGLLHILPEEKIMLIKAKDVHGNDVELTNSMIKDIAFMYNIKI